MHFIAFLLSLLMHGNNTGTPLPWYTDPDPHPWRPPVSSSTRPANDPPPVAWKHSSAKPFEPEPQPWARSVNPFAPDPHPWKPPSSS